MMGSLTYDEKNVILFEEEHGFISALAYLIFHSFFILSIDTWNRVGRWNKRFRDFCPKMFPTQRLPEDAHDLAVGEALLSQ